MARPASSTFRGIVAFSGMVSFIGALSVAPRVSISREGDFTSIRYHHFRSEPSAPTPADPGLVIAPKPEFPRPIKPASGRSRFTEDDWIFDTGATSHVCTKKALLSSYSSIPHGPHSSANFGPNAVPVVGIGDVTLDLPASHNDVPQILSGVHFTNHGRLTIHNVSHIPTAGINIISWSALKRAKGLKLRLVENGDGSLAVVNGSNQIMRFVPRNGLFFLDRGKENNDG